MVGADVLREPLEVSVIKWSLVIALYKGTVSFLHSHFVANVKIYSISELCCYSHLFWLMTYYLMW